MPIRYRLVSSQDPRTGRKGFAARAAKNDRIGFDRLVRLLADETAVGPGDVWNVLSRLAVICGRELQEGRSITLPDIGTLHVTVGSELIDSPEEFHPQAHLREGRVRFRLAGTMRELPARFRYERADGGATPGIAGGPPPQPGKEAV